MEEKPRNAKDPRGPSKGFLIATYSALGIMLIFAVALGYRHFVSPSGEHSQIAQTIPGHADFESLPVGNFYQDMPMDFGMTADAWARAATAPPRPAPTTAPAAGMATAITTPPPTQNDPEDGHNQTQPPTQPPPQEPTQSQYEDDYPEEQYVATVIIPYWDDDPPYQAIAPLLTFGFEPFNDGDNMGWPVLGEIVLDFSMDALIFSPQHNGWRANDNIAIAADRGTQVRAAAAGEVVYVLDTIEFGHRVVIDHGNGWITTYSHLEENVAVEVGSIVSLGQIIGTIGQPSRHASLLGYHVAFSIRNNDSPINPHYVLAMR